MYKFDGLATEPQTRCKPCISLYPVPVLPSPLRGEGCESLGRRLWLKLGEEVIIPKAPSPNSGQALTAPSLCSPLPEGARDSFKVL